MDQLMAVARSSGQRDAQLQWLAIGAKRWNLRNIVFKNASDVPCNELTEVWLELLRSAGRARFHCWTNALEGYSGHPFKIRFCFYDLQGVAVREVGWSLSIPCDAGIEYRLELPFSESEFDASARLVVPGFTQMTLPYAQSFFRAVGSHPVASRERA